MLQKFSLGLSLTLLLQLALFGQVAVRVGFVNIGPYAQANAKHNLFCLIDNNTSNELNSIVLSWQNASDNVQSKEITNIGLFQWDNKLVDVAEQINIGAPADYLIKFWISSINSVPLDEPDTLKVNYKALEQTAQRFVFFENFTSSGCGSCSTANSFLREIANKFAGNVFLCSYHTDCYSGNPMCQMVSDDVEERKLLYNASYTPFSVLGSFYSSNSLSFDPAYFDSELQRPSAIEIDGSFEIVESIVTGSVTFNPFTAIPTENLMVRVVITQDIVEFNVAPGSNGEKTFYHVLRRVVRVPKDQIEPFANREYFTFNFSEDFSRLNVDVSKFRIAAFVQDTSTHNVLQAYELVNNTTSINPLGLKTNFRVFPNPVSSTMPITIELPKGLDRNYSVSIQTIHGQVLFKKEITSTESFTAISTENLPKGLLIITVKGENFSNTQKLIVQ